MQLRKGISMNQLGTDRAIAAIRPQLANCLSFFAGPTTRTFSTTTF